MTAIAELDADAATQRADLRRSCAGSTGRSHVGRKLSFQRTLDCALAHRRAVGETFLTDSTQLADGDVVLAFQIPRAHLLWGDHPQGRHDEFAVAEAARQASFVVFHEYLGIPLGLPFSMQRWDVTVLDQAAFADTGAPLQGRIRYSVATRMRQPDHGRMALSGVLEVNGVTAMTIVADVAVAPRADYRALRDYQRARRMPGEVVGGWEAAKGRPAARLHAGRVDRHDARNCVIAAAPHGGHHLLVVDVDHPAFFDHEYDHVPGPLLVEALRQAAVVTARAGGALGPTPVALESLTATFADFAEFGTDVELMATVDTGGSNDTGGLNDTNPAAVTGGRASLQLAVRQFGVEIATGRMVLRNVTADSPVADTDGGNR